MPLPPPLAVSLLATVAAHTAVDWPSFLRAQDLVWEHAPPSWDRGAFVGNGLVGAMVYAPAPHSLMWELGRTDITDDGNEPIPLDARPRLPIGLLEIETQAAHDTWKTRLDLWNAELSGTFGTGRTRLGIRSYVHADRPVLLIELDGPGSTAAHVRVRPALPVSDRARMRKLPITDAMLPPAPYWDEVELPEARVSVSVQVRRGGGAHAIAWSDNRQKGKRIILLAIETADGERAARQRAVAEVQAALRTGTATLRRTHRRYWHSYWPQSFVSLPDPELESFYWIQMYKLASATRPGRPAIDTLGPWYHRTPWPGIWWNLNLQLTYWPVYTANRLALGESLLSLLFDNSATLTKNVPPVWQKDSAGVGRTSSLDARSPIDEIDANAPLGSGHPHEIGNLVWALHNAWLHWRHTLDEELLRERLYPLLGKAVQLYLHQLRPGPDGYLHLPVAVSPEYPAVARDTNYDLSLLRWGAEALLDASTYLGLDDAHEPRRAEWRKVLTHLVPYPGGDDGFWIGADVPLTESHRHFSHLLMIYPLQIVDVREPAQRTRIERSLTHWLSLADKLEGYSFVGAAAMSALLGRGDDALAHLRTLVSRYVRRNTMYLEAGPVIETPLAAAQAIHELLLQSNRDVLRVFPAVPSSWRDVSFADLRAQGAFLVSAVRQDGQTRLIRIVSLAGAPLRLATSMPSPRLIGGAPLERDGDGFINLNLRRGESAVIVDGAPEIPTVRPVSRSEDPALPFGVLAQGPPAGVPCPIPTPRAQETVQTYELDDEGYVRDWLVLAPLPTARSLNGWEEIVWEGITGEANLIPRSGDRVCATGTRSRDTAVGPESLARWHEHHAHTRLLDFATLAPGRSDDAIGYAAVWLESSVTQPVEFRLGTSDQARVFIDGRPSLTVRNARAYTADTDRLRLTLPKGWTRVLVKVINERGRWLLSLRLLGVEGARLDNVRVATQPPP